MRARGLVHDILRVGFAVLGVVAMTYQFAKLNGSEGFGEGNFFSFFTIQSNVPGVAFTLAFAAGAAAFAWLSDRRSRAGRTPAPEPG